MQVRREEAKKAALELCRANDAQLVYHAFAP